MQKANLLHALPVYFANGLVLLFQVGPHEIYVVGREDDGGSLDDGAPSDAGSWETVDDNEMDLPDDPANVLSAARLSFLGPVIPLRSTF